MPSLVLCYAPSDEKPARELAAFLERNLAIDVCSAEAVVSPGFDLVDAAERGLSADAALVLLSPESVPKTWKRERWEPVFLAQPSDLQTHLGFVLLRDCRFPELLRRQRFFDLSHDFLSGARLIRNWLLRPDSIPSPTRALTDQTQALRSQLADAPGYLEDLPLAAALDFAESCADDFEAVFRIDCRRLTRAGILGHIGHHVGVRLPGGSEQNRAALRGLCAAHRWLLLFENVAARDRSFAAMGGRTSSVFVRFDAIPDLKPLDQIGAAFFSSVREQPVCASILGDACASMAGLLSSDFEAGLRLGWAIVGFLKSVSRFAEAVEILASMEHAARAQGDALALFRIEWEQSWLRDDSGSEGTICILPTAAPETLQLTLNFA